MNLMLSSIVTYADFDRREADEAMFLTLVDEHTKQILEFRERLLRECKPRLVALAPQPLALSSGPIPEDELSDIDAP